MEKIAILFSTNNINKSEDIKNYTGLQRRFCEVITMDEVKLNPRILTEYAGLLDCSEGNLVYNGKIRNNSGKEYKKNDQTYIKTATNKFIVNGPTITQLTASMFSQKEEILQREKNTYEVYDAALEFLYSLIKPIQNILNYELAMTTNGILINDILGKTNEKVYKLVKTLPEKRDSNTVYITPDEIKVLNEIIKLKDVIV
jgi:hypothetical protein